MKAPKVTIEEFYVRNASSLGLRLFRSLHVTDGGFGRQGKDLMTLLEDVE